jgi:hypothetical protein
MIEIAGAAARWRFEVIEMTQVILTSKSGSAQLWDR